MLECVNGNGQGCCDICLITKGFHRYWSSGLYYVRNKHGLYLRIVGSTHYFSTDEKYAKSAFCYGHALFVEETRKTHADWTKEG